MIDIVYRILAGARPDPEWMLVRIGRKQVVQGPAEPAIWTSEYGWEKLP